MNSHRQRSLLPRFKWRARASSYEIAFCCSLSFCSPLSQLQRERAWLDRPRETWCSPRFLSLTFPQPASSSGTPRASPTYRRITVKISTKWAIQCYWVWEVGQPRMPPRNMQNLLTSQ